MYLNKLPTNLVLCQHCHEPCEDILTIEGTDFNFCCHGCKTVFQILKRNDLLDYYKISENEKSQPRKIKNKDLSFQHFDTEEFQKDYVDTNKESRVIRFYLDNVHCMACLWLIEKTPYFIPGLKNARLDLTKSIATFNISHELAISELAKKLTQLGYYPHPLKQNETGELHIKKTQRKEFLRIGLAGAAMMNIMIYAISNYAGADGGYKLTFDWISFAFSLPVVFFSAVPFYESSIQALKQKRVNIDLPLSIAIVFGFLLSTYSIFMRSGEQYFDTIASLVFLILLSRYFVKYATQKGLDRKGLNTFFTNAGVKKVTADGIETIHSDYIKVNDIVLFEPGETILFDGTLAQEQITVDSSIISGESKPSLKEKGETVFAGSKILEKQALIKVISVGTATRIGKIVNKIQSEALERPAVVQKADIYAQRFVSIILSITCAAFTFYLYQYDVHTALNISLAIIIISCPCALALATPLAFIKALNLLKSKGIFIKSDKVLESLGKIKNLVLDKTGTITNGDFKVLKFANLSRDLESDEIMSIVYALESKSIHPIAITLKHHTQSYAKKILFNEITEENGIGIKARNQENEYYLGKPLEPIDSDNNHTIVTLYRNNSLIAYFLLGDEIKQDSFKATTSLRKAGINLILASGDQQSVTMSIGKKLGLKSSQIYGNLSPEQKADLVSHFTNVAMVGDGANDALAMRKSDIGIAVSGAMDISLRASDVFLTSPRLSEISELFEISKETEKIIKRNFLFSIAYNCVGVSLALFGLVSPLFAAIIMPLSSVTVLLSTIFGTKRLRAIQQKVSV